MSDKAIETSLHLYRVLSRAHRSVTEYSAEDVKQHGLQPTEFSVMELLYSKGPQPLQQIGAKILRTSGSVTYVIDKLEKNRLLERKNDPSDRRVTIAALTPAGKAMMDAIFPPHAAAITESFGDLDQAEKEQLIYLLKKIGQGAERRLEQIRGRSGK